MPKREIDLGPDDYAVKTKRGEWVQRDVPWTWLVAGAWFAFGIGWTWWYRAELQTATFYLAGCSAAFFLGMAVALWLKRFDQ